MELIVIIQPQQFSLGLIHTRFYAKDINKLQLIYAVCVKLCLLERIHICSSLIFSKYVVEHN